MDRTRTAPLFVPPIARAALAALAIALLALTLSTGTTLADAQTVNENATAVAQACADMEGKIDWENGTDADGNIVSQWAFCELKTGTTVACEYSGPEPTCLAFLTTDPQQPVVGTGEIVPVFEAVEEIGVSPVIGIVTATDPYAGVATEAEIVTTDAEIVTTDPAVEEEAPRTSRRIIQEDTSDWALEFPEE